MRVTRHYAEETIPLRTRTTDRQKPTISINFRTSGVVLIGNSRAGARGA